jgi:hypothetical protein
MLMSGDLWVTGFFVRGTQQASCQFTKGHKPGLCGHRQGGNARKAATDFRRLPLFCRFPQATPIPCGSEPARDGVVSVNIDIEWAGLIASRLAPTLDLVFAGYRWA